MMSLPSLNLLLLFISPESLFKSLSSRAWLSVLPYNYKSYKNCRSASLIFTYSWSINKSVDRVDLFSRFYASYKRGCMSCPTYSCWSEERDATSCRDSRIVIRNLWRHLSVRSYITRSRLPSLESKEIYFHKLCGNQWVLEMKMC